MPGWSPDPLVAVEAAWGADLTVLNGSSWTWSDITDDVLLEGLQTQPISITIGRQDESSATQTAVLKLTLDNRSGKYINGGSSPLWPYVRRGTPVRVRVSVDNGSTWSVRFQGQTVGFTPSWETGGRWSVVTLEASGPLRMLDQGTLPPRSVYRTQIPTDPAWAGMITYWPCEGGNGVTALPCAVPDNTNGIPRLIPYNPYIPKVILNQSADAFPCSAPLPGSMATNVGAGSGFDAMPTSTNTGVVHIRLMAGISSLPSGQIQPLCYFKTTNTATVATWGLMLRGDGTLAIQGFNSSGTQQSNVIQNGGFIGFNRNGTASLIGVTLQNSGSDLNWWIMAQSQSVTDTTGWFNGTFTGVNVGVLNYVNPVGPETSSTNGIASQNVIIGHVSAHNQFYNNTSFQAARNLFAGLPGELILDRLVRVAADAGLYVEQPTGYSNTETAVSITKTAGPQFYDTLSNILRETETTGQGLLYDGLGPGLTFIPRWMRSLFAAAPTLTLDAAAGHLMEPYDPIDDDQVLFNHVTVSRKGGSNGVEYVDQTGSEGTNTVGDHATSLTVNSSTDTGLVGYAQWLVGVGTITGFRYPTISFALDTNPSLGASWIACKPQSRIDVTNITAVRPQLSPDPVWLLLEGWTETIAAHTWRVVANTSSAEPWNVIRLAAATGSTGDDICHMDTDSSQLNTSAGAGATSISVRTNSGPLWVTSAGDADSFPFYVTVGGLRVQVTAVSGASSPQTFTLASPGLPAAKTGSTTPGAGAPISIWRPPVLGL